MQKPDNNYLKIGKITGTHGLKGALKIVSYAESSAIFKKGLSINIGKAVDQTITCLVNRVFPYKNGVCILLHGINECDQAEKLVGHNLFIAKEVLPQAKDDSYYWFDLIGLKVFTINNQYLGTLEDIIITGSNDVYVVHNLVEKKKQETLIPAMASVVIEINLIDKIMRVDLPEGL